MVIDFTFPLVAGLKEQVTGSGIEDKFHPTYFEAYDTALKEFDESGVSQTMPDIKTRQELAEKFVKEVNEMVGKDTISIHEFIF